VEELDCALGMRLRWLDDAVSERREELELGSGNGVRRRACSREEALQGLL
jgi:hypothetical protein